MQDSIELEHLSHVRLSKTPSGRSLGGLSTLPWRASREWEAAKDKAKKTRRREKRKGEQLAELQDSATEDAAYIC